MVHRAKIDRENEVRIAKQQQPKYYMYEMGVYRDDELNCYGQAYVVAKNEEEAKDLFLEHSENPEVFAIMEDKQEEGCIVCEQKGQIDKDVSYWIGEHWD